MQIHTHVQVAFQPALLCHGEDGDKFSTQSPAAALSIMPRLFVSKRFVAEVPKLKPVRSGASQLCGREWKEKWQNNNTEQINS